MPISPESDNPFSTPKEPLKKRVSYASNSALQISGKDVVVGHRAHFPHRCYICNEEELPGGKRMVKKLYYAPGAVYFLLLINLLILIIVYLIVRKGPVDLQYSLCATHRSQRSKRIMATWAFFCSSILCFFIAGNSHNSAVGWFGGALFLAFLIAAVVASKGPRPTKHLNGKFWISGCGPAFLHSIRNDGEEDE